MHTNWKRCRRWQQRDRKTVAAAAAAAAAAIAGAAVEEAGVAVEEAGVVVVVVVAVGIAAAVADFADFAAAADTVASTWHVPAALPFHLFASIRVAFEVPPFPPQSLAAAAQLVGLASVVVVVAGL